MADSYPLSVPELLPGPAIGAIAINYAGGDQSVAGSVRGIYIASGSSLKADMANGTTATFTGLLSGMIYALAVTKIYQTGSDVAGFVLY